MMCHTMADEMELPGNRLKILLLAGIAAGIAVTVIADQQLVLTAVKLVGGEKFPLYGIYVMNMADTSCTFFTPDAYLSEGDLDLSGEAGKACAEPYQALMLEQKIEEIRGTDPGTAVDAALDNATRALVEGDVDRAEEILSRIEVRKSYSID